VLAEEYIWRGAVINWLLASKLTRPQLILIATALYALPMACSRSLLLLAVAVALGAALTVQRLYHRSWVPCFVTHLTWNFLVFAVHPAL
jgi:membrane protease YdiL (CAAX protease family)